MQSVEREKKKREKDEKKRKGKMEKKTGKGKKGQYSLENVILLLKRDYFRELMIRETILNLLILSDNSHSVDAWFALQLIHHEREDF